MNFNKIIAVSVLMAGVITVPVYAAVSNDAGSLKVTGSFVDSSCLITQSQLDQKIAFDDLSKSEVNAIALDGVVISKPLTFKITDCPAGTDNIGIKFNFTPVDFGKNYLKNTGEGQGALFGISSGIDTTPIATDSKVYSADVLNEGTATVNAQVSIYRTAADYHVGDLSSTANVTLVYN